MKRKGLLTILGIMMPLLALAQQISTETAILDGAFRTLKISDPEDFFAAPIIRLGTDDRLVVSFDGIGDDVEYLRCRLLHCNADWRPSPLLASQYADGFNEMQIEDYAFSEDTFIHFVNYRVEIPAPGLQPLISGNYVLQIFREENPDDVVIQARFSVEEPLVEISAVADAYTDRGNNDRWQKVDIEADLEKIKGVDYFNDILVTVEPNSTAALMQSVRHPSRVHNGNAIYEHKPELIFPAGNEFLRFETVRADYPGLRIDSVRYVGPSYHAWVRTDKPRKYSEYAYDETQAGRYIVREFNHTDSDLGADYVMVNLTLEMPEMPGYDVFVDGEFSAGRFTGFNKMAYDIDRRAYTIAMPLKQGSYNYRYVAIDRADRRPNYFLIDGDKPETLNEYLIKVYIIDRTGRADRLVGHRLVRAHTR